MQLLFVGVPTEDAEPVLAALRQSGAVVRPLFVDTDTGIESLLKQPLSLDAALVGMRTESVHYKKVVDILLGGLPHVPIIAWSDDVQSDWLAEAYASGAWGLALATYPAQASQVIRQACQVRQNQEIVRQAKQSAHEVEQRESTLLAAARDPVAYVHEGMHIRANPSYLEFFGLTDADEIEGMPLLDLIAAPRHAEAKLMLRTVSQGKEIDEVMMDFCAADQTPRQARLSMMRSMYEGENCIQVALRPPAEMIAVPVEIELDGYKMMAEAVAEIQTEPDRARKTALLLASVSDTKAFDGLGLAYTTAFMSSLAGRFMEQAGGTTRVFDVDGRTLGVLAENIEADTARKWLTELRENLALHPIQTGTHSMRPLLVMGGVMLGPDWDDLRQNPFTRAEDMWRQARISRDIEWFDPSARDRDEDRKNRELMDYTRSALENGDFALAYRPIMPLGGENIEIFEGFIRMRGADGVFIRPDRFLPQAEAEGLGTQIDNWVMKQAVKSVADARRQKRDPRLIISLGLSSLLDEGYALRLAGFLDEKQVPPDRVIVQITEGIARAHQGAVERLCKQQKALGLELLVSRFLGEHESLDMLGWANPHWVKLDESWTRDLPRDDTKQASLKEIIALLATEKRASIADFVRDSATMTVLFASQVGYASGDFLAPEAQVMNAVEQ